jgi:hypothetical protein
VLDNRIIRCYTLIKPIEERFRAMFTVTYFQNYERKVTTWDTYEQANSYAMYLWDCDGVYGVKIEEVK